MSPGCSETTSECKQLTSDPTRCWLFLGDTRQTWGGASQTCISFGGHLAVEYDRDLHNAIAQEVATAGANRGWWIGIRRYAYEYWLWSAGLPLGKHM